MSADAAALAEWRRAVAARPTDAEARSDLGHALMAAGQLDEAAEAYRAALTLRPGHGPAHYNLGTACLRLNQPGQAEVHLVAALRLDPDFAGTYNNLGSAQRAQGRLAEAEASYRAAVALRPDLAGPLTNLGATLIALRRPEDALEPLREAIRLDPSYAEAANNFGGALLALDRLEEALAWFETARRLDPEQVQPVFGAAMALLSLGRFTEGFELYEIRWRDPQFIAEERERRAPVWDGRTDLAGQTLLLHAEQGLGDTIQFVRYAPLLRRRGVRVVLEVQPPLVRLCQHLADLVVSTEEPPPPHDVRCPLMSLPRIFGTTLETVPAAIPYLRATPRHDVRGAGANIGVAFAGAPTHPEDDLRSIAAALWRPVLRLPATFHLLQPAVRAADAAALDALPGLRRHDLSDFLATAEIVAALDAVVTVDTAVAHLAGALGRPVLLIVQHSADFRWLRGRDDSPWYPTIRLFRRGADEEWPAVLDRVAAALTAYVQPPSTTKV